MNKIIAVLSLAPLLWLGWGCANGGNHFSDARARAAERHFDLGVDRPATSQTLYQLARVLAVQGRDSEARYVLQELIQRDAQYIPAYCDLAELHMRMGRLEEARKWLEKGLDVSPGDTRLTGNLGMTAMMAGDYEEAIVHFARAAEADNEESRHRGNMAVALGLLGRYDEAFAEYEKILPVATAHYNIAILAQSRNDVARSQQEFAMAQKLVDSSNPAGTAWRAPQKTSENQPQ
jgi:Flp pilus assembly protein TadD